MATAEQFSLRWNNFQSNMTSGFHALWEGEDLVDVTLAADGRFLQAHKVVLSVCSPYFKTLFKVNPCKHPIVILKDVGYKDLESLLQFMYKGEVNVCQEELGAFLKTAEMLEVKGLTGDDGTHKSPPAAIAALTKTTRERPQTRNQVAEESRAVATSQFKRKRVSGRASPSTSNSVPKTEDGTVSSRGQSEYVEALAHAKQEPRDADSDDGGDSYITDKDTDSLILCDGSGNSGTHSDIVGGTDSLVFGSAHGQADSGGSQDNSQGNHLQQQQQQQQQHQDEEDEEGVLGNQVRGLSPVKSEAAEAGNASQVYSHSLSMWNSSRGVSILKKNIINQLWRPNQSRVSAEYRCTLCQKTFTRRDHLRTHERNLHGQDAGPFTCVICLQLYKNADSLRKHVTKYHFSRETATSTMTDVSS